MMTCPPMDKSSIQGGGTMIYPQDILLFTINEFSRACGISRASLLRMEECGFLKPYRIDPDNGYRYYDAHNVAEVGQFQLLQMLGLSRKEITEFYYQQVENHEFLKQQHIKLSQTQRILEELELRNDPLRQFGFSYVDLPETTCYCKSKEISSMEESETFFYTTHMESIKAGFKMMGTEPLFGLSENEFRISKNVSLMPSKTTACIPVVGADNKDTHLVTFKATRAFSGLAKGDYSIIMQLCTRFWKEVEKRKLKPTGRARFIGLVAPYTGRHISKDQFCYRLVVPVDSE